MAFHAAVLDQMKKYEQQGASRKRRYLSTALDKCDKAKRRATDPRKSRAQFEDLANKFDRLYTRPQVTQSQIEKNRVEAHRIDLIGHVAGNTSTAEQMRSFHRLLGEVGFSQMAKEQLHQFAQNQAVEKADRLYLALTRVLVEQIPLPPRGPALLRGDVLGAGQSSIPQSPSPEEVVRDRKWHPIATGTATTNEARLFRHEMLSNREFVDAVFLARKTCASMAPSEFEVNMMLRLDQALSSAMELLNAIHNEAFSKVGGDPTTHLSEFSEDNMSGRNDRGPAGLGRRASLASSHVLPVGWALTFIEMVANRRTSDEMDRLFHHKFKTEDDFQQMVLAQERRYRFTKLTAGYEKAMVLRYLGPRGSEELSNLFGGDQQERARLELLEHLLIARDVKTRNIITVTMPSRPDGSPWIVRGAGGQSPDATLPQTTAAASASARAPASGTSGSLPKNSTKKPKRR